MFLVWLCQMWAWVDTVGPMTNSDLKEQKIENLDMFGVKRCSHDCPTRSVIIDCTSDNLVCDLLKMELNKIQDGPCSLKICEGMKCLETRSGKAVCVKVIQNHTQYQAQSNTNLLDACKNGDMCRVKYILSEGQADINTRGQDGMTPLMLAAQNAHRQVFDFLVGQGSSMSILNSVRMNILHMACEGGNIPIIKYVLEQNVTDINSRSRDGSTAVMLTALRGHGDVFKLLVSKVADLTLVDDKGSTVLEKAIRGGNADIVRSLFNQIRVETNREYGGQTHVMQAAYYGKLDVFNFLVQKGADLSLMHDGIGSSDTILHEACEGGNTDIVEYVLEQNLVAINTKGEDLLTPVMIAAKNGHRDTFELLVKKGANLSPENTGGELILHCACFGGNADIVRYVLKQNVNDINSQGWNGQTAAMTSADKGYRVIFDLLIREGADITVGVDDQDNDILHLACNGGNVNIVKYVLKHNNIDINAKGNHAFTPAMMAADGGHREILDLLMRKGADLTLETASRCNVLHIACKGRFTQIVEYVISKDIVDINSQDFQGMSAVMLAAERGLGEVFDLLVSKSADLRSVNAKQENILHLACRGLNMDIVKYIVTQNIVDDINTRTKDEETPLMIAAISENKEAFDLLLQKGASLALEDNHDNTILHCASYGGKLEIAEFILAQNIGDINRRDGGMSAVMIAAFWGNREVFHLLEKKGANLSFVDRNGHDILYLACDGGNINIVKYVHSHVNLNTAAKKTTTSEAGDVYAVCDQF